MDTQTKGRVLVVDDEEPIRVLMQRIVGDEGYEVILAADAEQALAQLEALSMDAILLDLHMPGEYDGEELLFLLRDQGNDIPIIIVSGWVDDEATMNNPECVHAVLKKPINREVLLTTLDAALAPKH